MVTVYTTPACVQCKMTKSELARLGVEYREVKLQGNDEAIATVKEHGFLAAPVVNVGDTWWYGFRPDMLSQLAA